MSEDVENSKFRFVVLFSCFINIFLTGGIGYGNVGIYHIYWMETFEADNAQIAMIGSLSISLCSLLGPLASIVSNLIGHRLAIIVGGLLSSVGMLASAFARNPGSLLAFYGLITGAFWCLAYIPGFMAATYYFPAKHHAIVIGICSSGMGLGPFVAPLVIEKLTEYLTWRGTMIIQAGINLNLIVCGMTLIKKQKRMRQNFTRIELFKDPYFLNIVVTTFVASLGTSVVFIHLAYCVETVLNVGNFESSLVLTMCGLGSFIGRLAHGYIATHPRVNVVLQYIISFMVMGTMTLCVPFASSLGVVMALSAVIGLTIGAYGTVPGVLITRIVEPSARTSAFGYQQFSLGVGLLVGGPIGGLLYDKTGNYAVSMYSGAAMLFLAALLKLVVYRQWNKRLSKYMNEIVVTEENTRLEVVE